MLALEEKGGDHQSYCSSSWGQYCVHQIHPAGVKSFYKKWKPAGHAITKYQKDSSFTKFQANPSSSWWDI